MSRAAAKTLAELLDGVAPGSVRVRGTAEVLIAGLTADSRAVRPGYLFAALAGRRADGHRFLAQAAAGGAAALLVERGQGAAAPAGPAVVEADDLRGALGAMADRFHDHPSAALDLVCVTGTNGKTTVTRIVEAIAAAAGRSPGVIGTISRRWAGRERPAPNTTPEAVDLQSALREMADAGVDLVALEASSHALEQRRLAGCRVRVAVFTNLGRDHLDFHGDLERYFAAKARLFTELAPAHAVVNADDPEGRRIAALAGGNVATFGLAAGAAFRGADAAADAAGLRFAIEAEGGRHELASPLVGRHNVMNILAAAAAARALGIGWEAIRAGVAAMPQVPGRLERVRDGGLPVFVDFAHTPDALENALGAARELVAPGRRLIAVFGCGGDRDRGKRPLMGGVAARLADLAIVTSDNPRGEDPEAIIDEIVRGVPAGARVERVADRRAAIRAAVAAALAGDVVVIAGKGHEEHQEARGEKHRFSDRDEARAALAAGAPLSLAEILAATGGRALAAGTGEARGASIDTRELRGGELFVALDGPRSRGHEFVERAFAAGAWGALVPAAAAGAGHLARARAAFPGRALVAAADTRRALGDLAARHRRRVPARVCAITGSNGKTTTKELAAAILARRGPTHRSAGNQNSQEGLPLSVLAIGPHHRAAVLEMGMDEAGGIARLAEIAAPRVGVVTNVGPAHLAGVGSLAGVRGAKGELLRSLGAAGTAVVGRDDEESFRYFSRLHGGRTVTFGLAPAADVRAEEAALGADAAEFTLVTPWWAPGRVALALPGAHNVLNALAAVAAARSLDPGVSLADVRAGLAAARTAPMRLQETVHGPPRVTVVNDAYNANPASMLAAFAALRARGTAGERLVLVLGDMREQGGAAAAAHREIGRAAAALAPRLLAAVGEHAAAVLAGAREAGLAPEALAAAPDADGAAALLAGRGLREGDVVLLKGSRGLGLERVAVALRERGALGPAVAAGARG